MQQIETRFFEDRTMNFTILTPDIPDRTFDLDDFEMYRGWKLDFVTALNRAILKCHASGGGTIAIPARHYEARGPIRLKSRVHLAFEDGASIVFSANRDDYLVGDASVDGCVLSSFEGSLCYNYSPLVYAVDCHNIRITGRCTIDANGADTWLPLRDDQQADRQLLMDQNNQGVLPARRIYGRGHHLRPPFFFFLRCTRILLEGLHLINAGFWMIHPLMCTHAIFRGLRLESYSINSDGIDPESCSNVLIEQCTFLVSDDNIAIKSGRDRDGMTRRLPSQHILIRQCVFGGLNGVSIGSEVAGGARHIYVDDCCTAAPLVYGILIKTNRNRGGSIQDIYFRNLKFDDCHTGIRIDMNYKNQQDYQRIPVIRDVYLQNVRFDLIRERTYDFRGLPESRIQHVVFDNVQFPASVEQPMIKDAQEPIWSNITGEAHNLRNA
jgi:polygalacturonase